MGSSAAHISSLIVHQKSSGSTSVIPGGGIHTHHITKTKLIAGGHRHFWWAVDVLVNLSVLHAQQKNGI